MPKNLRIERSGDVPELYLYDEIGPALPDWWGDTDLVSAKAVMEALDEIGDVPEFAVRISSPGGDVFEGVAIYNALARHSATIRVEIDSLAASIASVIAMAGDEIVIAGNAMIMIHQAWTCAMGNAAELATVVESLEKIDKTIVDTYAARARDRSTPEQITEWLVAETWMTADEAIERGFADRAGELKGDVQARVPAGRFKNTPKQLIAKPNPPAPESSQTRDRKTTGLRCLPAIAARINEVRRRNAAEPYPA